ncbi:MAG: hypothetical protein V5A74_11490 [Desulfohalobiaceae bacterium]
MSNLVYALDTESLNPAREPGLDAFKRAIEGHVLESAEVTGRFEQE